MKINFSICKYLFKTFLKGIIVLSVFVGCCLLLAYLCTIFPLIMPICLIVCLALIVGVGVNELQEK